MNMKKKISIVIPAYNEEGNIPRLLDNLISLRKREGWDCEIVVSNDNSRDRTGEIAEEYSAKYGDITVVHRTEGEHGMGHALKDGTRKSSGDIVVWVMGDCSDNLETIPEMLKKIDEGFDMVIGSRYMPGGSRGELSKDKALLGQLYTTICRLVFGIPVHDLTNAFRAFKREVFEDVKPESGDFAISPEFSLKAHMKKYRIGQVPTTYYNRRAGQANFKIMKMGLRYCSQLKHRFTK